MDSNRETLTITPLQPGIGAEIGGVDLRQPLSTGLRAAIYDAAVKYKVIFFRDQHLTPSQHIEFARMFARNTTKPFEFYERQPDPDPEHPEILRVKADGKVKTAADTWHSDGAYMPMPLTFSVLLAKVIPPLGGDTLFCDCAAVYAGLDEATRARIDPLRAVFNTEGARQMTNTFIDPKAQQAHMEANPPVEHPVVRIHPETGERVMYVNEGTTCYILDLEDAEELELRRLLCDQVKRPEYQVRFQWRPGSIAVWDNRSVQHYATGNYSEPRHMERVAVCGTERPVGPGERAAADPRRPVAAI